MTYTLEIFPENEEVRSFYLERANHDDDAGVDLYVPKDTVFNGLGNILHSITNEYVNVNNHDRNTSMIDMKIKCRMVDENGDPVSYYLYARSSITKTPLLLANSVGIIDRGYRGSIMAAFRNLSSSIYHVEKGTRLVQLCAPNLQPIKVKLVDSLASLGETKRGEGGFGSTGV